MLTMKNIGLIGLVVALVLVFGGYLSYRATGPGTQPSVSSEGKENQAGAQFIQMKPDNLPPVEQEAGQLVEQSTLVGESDEEKTGAVSGARDANQGGEPKQVNEASKTAVDQPGVVVSMTDTGFFPSTITVKAGTIISFVNDGQALHWPASDPHPAHDGLPGFDAGDGVATGDTFEFQFDRIGEWSFHDHLVPSQTGKIIVE